jgi:glycosyltransferase involved in cell wall biosynthesis
MIVDMFVIRHYDRVIGVSDDIVEGMRKLCVGKLSKIANGVDSSRFHISRSGKECLGKYGIESGDFVVGMVSSLTAEKNHHSALEAISLIDKPHVKLLIVGVGELFKDLRKKVVDCGLTDRVFFAGALPDVTEVMSAIDVFLMPSLREGLPMALLEAMASGKAVVASNVGDIGNVIDHKVNGLLMKKTSIEKIKSSIEWYLENPEKILQHGKSARRTVVERYSCKRMVQNYCTEYRAMTSRNSKKNKIPVGKGFAK